MNKINVAILSSFYLGGRLSEEMLTDESIGKIADLCFVKASACDYDESDEDAAYQIANEIEEDYLNN